MTLSRSPTTLVNRDKRSVNNGTCITDGASGTTALKGHPSTTLARTKVAASAAAKEQSSGRYVTSIQQFIAYGAILAKSLVYLSLFVIISVIAFIYKYLILAVIYIIPLFYPAEFDRDAFIQALSEIETPIASD